MAFLGPRFLQARLEALGKAHHHRRLLGLPTIQSHFLSILADHLVDSEGLPTSRFYSPCCEGDQAGGGSFDSA